MYCDEIHFCGRDIKYCEKKDIIQTESSEGGMHCILRRQEEYAVFMGGMYFERRNLLAVGQSFKDILCLRTVPHYLSLQLQAHKGFTAGRISLKSSFCSYFYDREI